jgi:hypothetical protein
MYNFTEGWNSCLVAVLLLLLVATIDGASIPYSRGVCVHTDTLEQHHLLEGQLCIFVSSDRALRTSKADAIVVVYSKLLN